MSALMKQLFLINPGKTSIWVCLFVAFLCRISQKLDGGRMRSEPQQTPSKQSADPDKEMGPGILI